MRTKTAIVTGGTGALGRVIVNRLADEGVKVYVPSRSMKEFSDIFDESIRTDPEQKILRKIYSFECNAQDEESVKEFVENVSVQENGQLDFLINTVGGIGKKADVSELTARDLDEMYDLNLKTTFYFTREVLNRMIDNNFGRIISVGAIAGMEISPGRFAYSMAKAGVINLMETVSEEVKDKNIRCNTIIPSIIDTPANREWGTEDDIKKWVKPQDIAEIIYSYISNEFSPVRGSNIKVYGSY